MNLTRRGFLKGIAGILAAGVAPAVLPSGIIMPIKKLWTPSWYDVSVTAGANPFVHLVVYGKDGSSLYYPVWEDGLGTYKFGPVTVDAATKMELTTVSTSSDFSVGVYQDHARTK